VSDLNARNADETPARAVGGTRSAAARLAGQSALEPAVLEDLLTRYRALTTAGLADFAIVESYLSTAAKWGITKIDALRDLFNGHTWKPPGLEPAG
jgi:hypothetical protein